MDDGSLRAERLCDAPAAYRRRRRTAGFGLALSIALGLVPASAAATENTQLIGRSVEGRPVTAIEVGTRTGAAVLVVGCIHGNEAAGIAIARRLAHENPRGIDLWIVPALNPDGLAAKTRGNAHGVDLNRNFPYRWRPLRGVYASGRRPLSEPEARIAYNLIRRIHPLVTIWFHQHLDLVWASGGNLRVERRFAEVSGLPYRRLPPLRGSAIDWQNRALAGTTAFAAELPAGSVPTPALTRYVRAAIAAARLATHEPR